jgi:hypothetical protein
MKTTLIGFLVIGFLFFSGNIHSQETSILGQNAPDDKIQALKDTLHAMSERTDNELFRNYCTSFTEVIDAQADLSASDINLLSAVYDTFCLEKESGNCRDFSACLNRDRPLIIAWKSPADGQLSFAALRLPLNWDPESSYPLYIHLHGLADDTDRPIDFLCRYFLRTPNSSYAYEDGYLLLPWGRGNLWYQGISETDIWECKAAAEQLIKIDFQRQFIVGHSMGGYGSWYIASRSPDVWAAFGVEAGALWYGDQGTLSDGTIQKLKDLPAYFVVGVQDGLYDVNLQAFNLLTAAGDENIHFASFNGGHEHLDWNEELMYLWLHDFVNEDYTNNSEITAELTESLRCYPNPFSECTHLAFVLEKNSKVELTIYNLAGERIETLFNRALGPGYHEATFAPGASLPGVYLCKLEIEGKSSQRKFLVKIR